MEGSNHVVILTDALWQRQFHGDREVIGRTAKINDQMVSVIGVLPADFRLPQLNSGISNSSGGVRPIELFTPLVIDRSHEPLMGSFNYLAIGRLRPGVSVRSGEQELTRVTQGFAREHHIGAHLRANLQTIQRNTLGSTGQVLWLLLAAVCGVLLIGCVNLASLQVARSVGRQRENAIRSAMGASGRRIALTQLAESCVLGAAGGALGVLLAYWGVHLLVRAAPVNLPRLDEVQVNGTVLLVSVLVTIGTVFLFGLLPAWEASRTDPQQAMQRTAGRSVAGGRSAGRMRFFLVCMEVCCTTVLLIVSAAALKSLFNALHTDRAFEASGVVVAEADLYKEPYSKDAERIRFDNDVLDRLRRLPGVEAAALTQVMPLTGNIFATDVGRADRPFNPERQPLASFRWISPDYFAVLRIPMLAGRALEASDSGRKNAVISQACARALWPKEDPLGRKLLTNDGGKDNTFTVVGIAADARTQDVKDPGGSMFYYPFQDDPPYATFFVLRTAQSPEKIPNSVRRAIWSVDSEVAIPTLKTLDEQVEASLATERFTALLLSCFGGAAIALALLGVYGVLTFFVALRTREIGVRIALGADRRKIYELTFATGMQPVLVGMMAGALIGWAATRSIASLLFAVRPGDPLSIGGAIAVLLAAASAATLLPSRRAASIDPAVALRNE
jgi:predicted permease